MGATFERKLFVTNTSVMTISHKLPIVDRQLQRVASLARRRERKDSGWTMMKGPCK